MTRSTGSAAPPRSRPRRSTTTSTWRSGRPASPWPTTASPPAPTPRAGSRPTSSCRPRPGRGEPLRRKLSDKTVAAMSRPSLQRHVLEIYLPEPNQPASPAETGVKVRHILYAPKDDADGAEDLPADDPAWAAAKAEADAAFAALKRDPKRFDAMARADSDEPSAKGIKGTGGKQPWYYPTSGLDPAIKGATF